MSSEKIKNFSYILFFFGRGPFLSAYLIVFLPLVLDLMKYNSNINGNVHFLFFPMAPASALVITNGLTCLSVILLSPAIGGISDYGDYRRKFIFYFLGIFVSFMSLPFFLVTYQSWLLAAFILVVAFTAFECCYALITSYLSEISNNKEERSFLSSFSVISENLSIICILIAMPIFLIGEKPRNLITNGNFEVPDSFQSWQIESGGSIQKCERRYDFLDVLKFSSAKCWRGENNVKQAKADLEIFVPKNKEITLFQQKKIYYPFNGDFRLTLKSSTKKLRQFVKTTLSILQKDKNNKNLLEKTSLVFQVTSKDQFISTKFDVLEATRLLEFRITMKSVDDVSSIMKVSNIETILSINKVHIWILFLCAVWFTVITFVCVLLLGKKEKEISDVEIRNKGIFMFGFALLRKTVLNFIENQDFFDNIIANILWGSGFSAFNTLVLIYLEDKYAFSSSKLALTFLLISTSIVAGAYLCYILESKYGRWNTALVFFSVWVVNPFFLLFLSGTSIFSTILLCIYFGVTIGIIYSLKYSIFANIVPESKEGEYMGFLYFSTKLTELLGSVIVIIGNLISTFFGVLVLCSICFAFACVSFFPFLLRGRRSDFNKIENIEESDKEISKNDLKFSVIGSDEENSEN